MKREIWSFFKISELTHKHLFALLADMELLSIPKKVILTLSAKYYPAKTPLSMLVWPFV